MCFSLDETPSEVERAPQLRRMISHPARPADETFGRERHQTARADRFIQAFTEGLGDLDAVDIEWLRKAGLSQDLCKTLQAFAKGQFTARDVAIAALYLIVSEAESDRFPREQCRLVRQSFSHIEGTTVEDDLVDLLDAIRSVAKGRRSWASIVRGHTLVNQ